MPYKDPVLRKQKRREYYLRNRNKNIAYSIKWKKEHPENRRRSDAKYRKTEHFQKVVKKRIQKYMKTYNSNLVISGKKKQYDINFRKSLKGRIAGWKQGATSRGLEWSVSYDDIANLPLVCSETGLKLTLSYNKPNTASLDRIDNTKGYTKDNIRFVCWYVNRMRHTLTIKDFHILVQMIYKHNHLEYQ